MPRAAFDNESKKYPNPANKAPSSHIHEMSFSLRGGMSLDGERIVFHPVERLKRMTACGRFLLFADKGQHRYIVSGFRFCFGTSP